MTLLLLIAGVVGACIATAMAADWIHDPHALAWLCAATALFIAAHLPFERFFR